MKVTVSHEASDIVSVGTDISHLGFFLFHLSMPQIQQLAEHANTPWPQVNALFRELTLSSRRSLISLLYAYCTLRADLHGEGVEVPL